MNSTVKTVIFWLVIVISAFLLWQVVRVGSGGQKEKEVNLSEFLNDVDQGNVREVTINGQEVRGKYADGQCVPSHRSAQLPRHDQKLRDKGVNITISDVSSGSWPLQCWSLGRL